MSNFYAPTRRKGSNDEFREAAWLDGHFGPRKYGVRFRGGVDILDGDNCEIAEVATE